MVCAHGLEVDQLGQGRHVVLAEGVVGGGDRQADSRECFGDLAEGDLGQSLSTGQPVLNDLLSRLPASLELTFAALLLSTAIALPIGILVSTVVLAVTYYLVLTPIGLLARLFGYDPMARRPKPVKPSARVSPACTYLPSASACQVSISASENSTGCEVV